MKFSFENVDYWVEVKGKGDPVVLLHGFTGSSNTWDSLTERLHNHLKVITIDLPGHAKTKVKASIKMEAFCQHLKEILFQLDVKKTAIVGYSLGGRTALSFAMFYPEMVSSLVLESASPGLATVNQQIERQAKDEVLAKRIENEGVPAFVDYWESIPLFNSQKRLPTRERDRIKLERLSQSASGLVASLEGMGTGVQPSWWTKLPTLTMKVLLVVGELDKKFVAIANRMREHLKNCHLEIVGNAGHAVHVEQADFFDTIVSDFLLDNKSD